VSVRRIFYTEHDIEDMVCQGKRTLMVDENTTLTSLAFEKARALGLSIVNQGPSKEPPESPVRPYVSQAPATRAPAPQPLPPQPATAPPTPAFQPATAGPADLRQRIMQAVQAKMGSQIDATLLDSIISRILASTGLK
jgi:hypothetical protein